jgi:hypothetical protein
MTLRVLVFAEPRLRLAGGFGAAVIQQASDDNGVRLDRPAAARVGEFAPPLLATPVDGAWAFAAHLSAPAGDATALALCKGSIRASVAVRHGRLELANPLAARDTPLAVGELRATIVEMKKAAQPPDRYFLSVLLDLQGRPLDRGALLCSLHHGGLKVLDAAGHTYSCRVAGISGSAQRTVAMVEVSTPSQGDARLGPPTKLVWDAPVQTRMVDIPFEFKDVPLP